MKLKFLAVPLIILAFRGFSGNISSRETLEWTPLKEAGTYEKTPEKYFYFTGAQMDAENGYLPEFTKRFPLGISQQVTSVRLIDPVYETVEIPSSTEILGIDLIGSDITIEKTHSFERKKKYGRVTFVPLRRNQYTGQLERLVSFELSIETETGNFSDPYAGIRRQKSASNSVLAQGEWFKIGVTEDGVYKLSYTFLENLGLDMSTVLPQNIRLYGNGGGMLPEFNGDFRHDDLQENAIRIVDGNDGSFDRNDYVLFYGQSPHRWKHRNGENVFYHETHRYSDTTYYFITADLGPGKRIQDVPSSTATKTHTVTSFNTYTVHNPDNINLIKSGRDWFGEIFDAETSREYTFEFPNISLTDPAQLNVRVAAKSKIASHFTVAAEGSSMSITVPEVSFNYPSPGGNAGTNSTTFTPKSSLVKVKVTYDKPLSSSRGWMDYIEINARKKLIVSSLQLNFRDLLSVGPSAVSEFIISGTNANTMVWNVTDPLNVQNQLKASSAANPFTFVTPTPELKKFIAFNGYLENVRAVGRVENQNLHSLDQQDMLVITHPLFLTHAEQLADIHREDGLRVAVATTPQIFNEFSSGAQDLIGIRDFIKMFYNRATSEEDMPRYVLMFGDASYDLKHRITGNTNFVPSYQSKESFRLPISYVSDDYFGLLDPNEGTWDSTTEDVDIGFGRFPVQTTEEAEGILKKIRHYTSLATMEDWRNVICFVADDQDISLHMGQANSLAKLIDTTQRVYNLDKIFIDAYQQVSTAGGQRYPDAENAINKRVEQGALILNYTGHGGESGWAHEEILSVSDILGWQNIDKLPLFVTATCEFSRFDDPNRISGGEYVLLNDEGGGIALFTTVRTVYAGENFALNTKFYENVFEKINNRYQRMGDIFRHIKNEHSTINTRNFTLLGDPALRLNYPELDVKTSAINGNSLTVTDTVSALEKMTISGYVADNAGNKLTNYNGILYPTIFDKATQITTLNNDGEGSYTFSLQKNKLFKGKVSVKNGEFSFSFIVPKDISYEYGAGKISYYGENGTTDGNGYYEGFVIGGTSSSAVADNQGPQIELYMNDENFVYGGITDENPLLLAKLRDEHGINMVGTGLGHDILATIDKNTEDAIVLNDFYEADIDSYQSGVVKYPFSSLPEGKHTLTLKAWDVYNNSSEQTIEFVVERAKEIEIAHVLNYPNPFTTRTEFWFQHNQPSRLLDVRVQIFTVSGKLIKTIDRLVQTEGYTQHQVNPIVWNGRDDFGDKLGRGVYIYKLTVRSRNNGSVAEKIEKLVIL